MAKIELREFSIQLNASQRATHQFLIKHDDNGEKAEMHGVAIFPHSRDYNGVAVQGGNSLKVAIYPPTNLHPTLTINNFHGLFSEDQLSEIIFTGTQEEVNARWNAAINAGEVLNARTDLKYELSGGSHDDYCTGNGNSVTSTLEKIMGFTPHKLNQNVKALGLEKNLLSPNASEVYIYLYDDTPWESGGDYIPDEIDLLGESLATITTNTVDSCIIS